MKRQNISAREAVMKAVDSVKTALAQRDAAQLAAVVAKIAADAPLRFAAEADRVATAMVPIETEADAARAIQLYEAKPMGRA
jgi:hypothetical protein